MMSNSELRIVFVGAHMEAKAPLERLIAARENIVGLFTLDDQTLSAMSGGTDLTKSVGRIPIKKAAKVNTPESVAWIRALQPDILLVVGWTQLLSPELLTVPRITSLGFHASLLPKYRGRAPVNWALINDEKQTGNTMIVLEPGADEGDIVAQRTIEITDEDDCRTIYEKVSLTECDMLGEILPLIREGRMPRRKQNSLEATVMPKRRPQDGLIDWSWPPRRLYNWVRALTDPYPGAFCFYEGQKITVWKASLQIFGRSSEVRRGFVHLDLDGYPVVITGDGHLKLLRVQRESELAVSGAEAACTFLKPPAILNSAIPEFVS